MSADKHWTIEGGTTKKRRRVPLRTVVAFILTSLIIGIGYGLFLAQPNGISTPPATPLEHAIE